jgi:hypothetical protein
VVIGGDGGVRIQHGDAEAELNDRIPGSRRTPPLVHAWVLTPSPAITSRSAPSHVAMHTGGITVIGSLSHCKEPS